MAIAVSRDGKMLASGSFDSTIKLWDAQTGRLQKTFTIRTWPYSLDFDADGKVLWATFLDDKISRLNVLSGAMLREFVQEAGSPAYKIRISPDGKVFATINRDKTVRVADVAKGTQLAELKGHTDQITDLAFKPDGKWLATSCKDGKVKLWDLVLRNDAKTWVINQEGIWAIAFSPDGKTLAAAGEAKRISIWDIARGKAIREIGLTEGGVRRLQYSPNGRMLAACENKKVSLWETVCWKGIGKFEGHANVVFDLTFGPDGQKVYTCSGDNTVKMWKVGQ